MHPQRSMPVEQVSSGGLASTHRGRIEKALFPHVLGKMGRSTSPTDPAPLSMAETIITLKPRDQWRPGMTWDRLLEEMDAALQFPGMPNIFWMPIQTRTEMLATGIRTSLGIKVFGPDLGVIEKTAIEIEERPTHRTAHPQCFCRAFHRGLLPRFQYRSSSNRPVWIECRRHRTGDHGCRRRLARV